MMPPSSMPPSSMYIRSGEDGPDTPDPHSDYSEGDKIPDKPSSTSSAGGISSFFAQQLSPDSTRLNIPPSDIAKLGRVDQTFLVALRKENDMLISKNNSLKAAVRKAQEVGHETERLRKEVRELRREKQNFATTMMSPNAMATTTIVESGGWFDSEFDRKMVDAAATMAAMPANQGTPSAAATVLVSQDEADSEGAGEVGGVGGGGSERIKELELIIESLERDVEKAKELHGEEMAKVMDELNGSNSKNMMLTDRCNSLEEEVKGLKEEVMEMERVGKETEMDFRLLLKGRADAALVPNIDCSVPSSMASTSALPAPLPNPTNSEADHLKTKVQALEEWAQASAEGKRKAMEQVRELEQELLYAKSSGSRSSIPGAPANGEIVINNDTGKKEKIVLRMTDVRFVVTAGGMHMVPVKLPAELEGEVEGVVVLTWEFEVYGGNDIGFSILGGKKDNDVTKTSIIRQRKIVKGGSKAEIDLASWREVRMQFDNKGSWVRPRTVKIKWIEGKVVDIGF